MNWLRGGEKYIHTADGRFYITKSRVRGENVYTLSDNNVLVRSERGEGALERCKVKAEELVK